MGSEDEVWHCDKRRSRKANESNVNDSTEADDKNSSYISEGKYVDTENPSLLGTYSKRKIKKKDNVLKAAEREATKWGKDVFSEVDYPIERNFLHKLYDTCEWDQTQFQASGLLPSLVQVVDVEILADVLDADLNLLGICDGQNIFGKTQKFESKMPLISVLTRCDVSKHSVIRIEAAYIGDWSREADRAIIQDLTGDQVNEVNVPVCDIYATEIRKSVMHNLVMVLERVSVVAEGSKIGHLLWEEQLLWGSPGESEAATLRWFKKATLLMEDPKPSLVNFQFPCGKQIPAHRKMLMGTSEVWDAHFSAEAIFADKKNVKLEDVSAHIFHKLLQWVYGTCPQFPSLEVVFDLLYLAEKYLIQDLQTLLIGKISEHLDNIPSDTFLVSELNKTDNVKVFERVFKTLDTFILPLILDPQHLDLDFATVSLVLSRPSLFCDEFRLARWLFAWARHNKPDEEQAATLASLIKWEMLAESEVEWLLQRPEADFMGSARLLKNVTSLRDNQCTVQTLCSAAPEGLQKPSFLRSQGPGIEDYGCYYRESYFHETQCIIPIIFPVSAETTSFPVVLLPDGDTLVRPVINWDDNPGGLEVELLRMGSLSGKSDTIRDSSDLAIDLRLLGLVLVSVRDGKWVVQRKPGLDYRNKTYFSFPRRQTLTKDLLSREKNLQGFLKIFQFKRSEIDDLDDFIAYCDIKRELERDEEVSEDEFPSPGPGGKNEFKEYLMKKGFNENLTKKVRASSEDSKNTAELLEHEDIIMENKKVMGQGEEDVEYGTPEPAKTPERARTPEPESDFEASVFGQGNCAFSDDEENTGGTGDEHCLKKQHLARVRKKTDGKRKHSLIASIENDEAGEGVFNQGSWSFSDDEEAAGDTKRRTSQTKGPDLSNASLKEILYLGFK